jgi:cation diffusion facilitator family transporter
MKPLNVARLAIAVGLLVLAAKYLAWQITGSVALYSDALESIVNVIAAVGAYGAVRVSRQPPDAEHPWGHGKAEYFSAVAEGVLIALAALAIVREALPRVFDPVPAEELGVGTLFSVGATAANGALGWLLVRAGRETRSPALRADGLHLLTDVLTTSGVLLGIGLAHLTGWWLLDPLLALVVALQILVVGWNLVRTSTSALMDEGLPPADLAALAASVQASADGARPEGLRARRSGPRLFAELRLLVPASMTVGDSHRICDRIEEAVRADHPDAEVIIHVEPDDAAHT